MKDRRSEDKVFIFSLLTVAIFLLTTVYLLLSGNAVVVTEVLGEVIGVTAVTRILFFAVTVWYGFMIVFISGMARVMYGAEWRRRMVFFVLNGIVFLMQTFLAVLFIVFYAREMLFFTLTVSASLLLCTGLGFVNANAAMNEEEENVIQN